jgi:hypothetical protein
VIAQDHELPKGNTAAVTGSDATAAEQDQAAMSAPAAKLGQMAADPSSNIHVVFRMPKEELFAHAGGNARPDTDSKLLLYLSEQLKSVPQCR